MRIGDILPVTNQALVTTERGTVPVTDPMAAEIWAEPSATLVTKPVVGPTVAMDNESEVQLATLVAVCMVPSE
jgi:hypothetical protein